MSKNDVAELLTEQRGRLREWLAGDRAEPFELENNAHYCLSKVFCPDPISHLKMTLRYILLQLGAASPFCPMKVFFYRLAGVKIGREACISPGVVIDPVRPDLIEIEDGVCLGMGCRLMTHEYTAGGFRLARLKIRSGAVVGGWSTLRSGVTVGKKSTIGFNSYVNRDVPPGETVAGVPARTLAKDAEKS